MFGPVVKTTLSRQKSKQESEFVSVDQGIQMDSTDGYEANTDSLGTETWQPGSNPTFERLG
jgi:hypothetical protein